MKKKKKEEKKLSVGKMHGDHKERGILLWRKESVVTFDMDTVTCYWRQQVSCL